MKIMATSLLLPFQLGFGKSMPTNCVWVDCVSENVSDTFLCRQFSFVGPVQYEVIDRVECKALIYYQSLETAQRAVTEMRARTIGGKKIQVRDDDPSGPVVCFNLLK